MAAPAVIRSSDGEHYILSWDLVVVQLWRGTPSVTSVAAANRTIRACIAEHREQTNLLLIIEAGSPVPDLAARRELLRLTRDIIPTMSIAVAVAEGGGFRAATVRSVGIALTALFPHKMPLQIVDTVAHAAPRFAPHLSPTSGGPAAMVSAIAAIRAEIVGQGRR